jgi:iron complex transport system ATP-binding protein
MKKEVVLLYLSMQSVTCGYGGQPVLQDLSLTIAQGEFVAVTGPNGSGKSTLVKALTGALPVSVGQIELNGKPIRRYSPRRLAQQVAVVAQDTIIAYAFTVAEIVLMGRLPHLGRFQRETQGDQQIAHRAMALTDTLHLQDRLVTTLSGGERQRVLVARALAQEPTLLILDEPTAHLDIAHQVELLDLLKSLHREQGLTVIAVLHDLNLSGMYAERILMLRQGELFKQGTPAGVLTEETITLVYGCRVKVEQHPESGRPHVILLGTVAKDAVAVHA